MIQELKHRGPELLAQLLALWEASVRATHAFLGEADLRDIRKEVGPALSQVEALYGGYGPGGALQGFLGVAAGHIEMLFIRPEARGTGLGKALFLFAKDTLGATGVDVNEQNGQGLGFYLHMGCEAVGRSPLDSSGRPFPLLRLKLPPAKP